MLYGLHERVIALTIARRVCDLIDTPVGYIQPKENFPLLLLLETAAQETHLGAMADPGPYGAGVGICQFDAIGFRDVVERTPPNLKARVHAAIGVSMDDVQHRDLAFSPVLSFLWCRLFYRLRPGVIPHSLADRAQYWKAWYNTSLGKGYPSEYVDNAKRIVGPMIGGYPFADR